MIQIYNDIKKINLNKYNIEFVICDSNILYTDFYSKEANNEKIYIRK